MKSKTSKLAPVDSIADLFHRAAKDERYAKLAVAAANNLGGNVKEGDLRGARQWLETTDAEVNDGNVVEEINFCRDLV